MEKYSRDLRNLHTSLVYRLGVAERDARSDDELDELLELPKAYDSFNCMRFLTVGDYFDRLGKKLKAKAGSQR